MKYASLIKELMNGQWLVYLLLVFQGKIMFFGEIEKPYLLLIYNRKQCFLFQISNVNPGFFQNNQ